MISDSLTAIRKEKYCYVNIVTLKMKINKLQRWPVEFRRFKVAHISYDIPYFLVNFLSFVCFLHKNIKLRHCPPSLCQFTGLKNRCLRNTYYDNLLPPPVTPQNLIRNSAAFFTGFPLYGIVMAPKVTIFLIGRERQKKAFVNCKTKIPR